MPDQIDLDDPRYKRAAAKILRRHDDYHAEANITSAIRDFLIVTGLANSDEINEEVAPATGSGKAVDLTALNAFIEVKRRVGSGGGLDPSPEYVDQLDGYLAQAETDGRMFRMGVLTDGKHWLLRWPGAGPVRTVEPHGFTLEDPDRWVPLYEWLREKALFTERRIRPDRENVGAYFGPDSPLYEREITAFRTLYENAADLETIKVKRRLWRDLLLTALGEIARTDAEMDDLFVRHTYLSAVIGMVVQASFGVDIDRLAYDDPADLLLGRRFQSDTSLQGIVESDFFAWPAEVGGLPALKALAGRIARFDWPRVPPDVAAILYETIIPPDERRQLGEYYTPHWLARAMVREVVTDPLDQEVLDPACGSGTFVAEAVTHFIEAAERESLNAEDTLEWLRFSIAGIDVHPVAVHLARAAWVLAARPAIQAAMDAGYDGAVSAPVYLGDALQMRFDTGTMFAKRDVTIQVRDERNSELVFPRRLVEQAEIFDPLMGDIADCVERGQDPMLALDDHGIADPGWRRTLEATIATLQRLHGEGRDHIWAYYTRNLVRPVALSRSKVKVIIGNPPWLNYNKTVSTLRRALEDQSKNLYGIWAGGRYATHQDVAGLFFARCVDLYLKDGGVIGMVMPHSALQTGQYTKWRAGEWTDRRTGRRLSVDFRCKTAWDLERLQPNTFFPIPASVVFAERVGEPGGESALAGEVVRWLGKTGASDIRRERVAITDTSVGGGSPYAGYSTQGAVIVPRCLFFVEETESSAIVRAGRTVTVNPRRGSQDKRPWRDLDLTAITQQTVETAHLFDVHLGETLAPYVTLNPLKTLLPIKRDLNAIPADPNGVGGVGLGSLERRMRERWRTVSGQWEQNKSPNNRLDVLGQLDYYGKLTAQLEWRRDHGGRPVRVVYTSAGAPTAALLHDDDWIVDYKLFWTACRDVHEGYYLLAIINSECLAVAVNPLTTPNWAGKVRDLQKHLWKLPIPEFDAGDPLHLSVSRAGRAAAEGAARELAALRQSRSKVTVTIARRELRKWLRESEEGKAVEEVVRELLGLS